MITETLNYWKTSHPDVTLAGIHENQTGTDAPKIVEINGIRIAILDYTFPAYGSQDTGSDQSSEEGTEDSSSSGTAGSNSTSAKGL